MNNNINRPEKEEFPTLMEENNSTEINRNDKLTHHIRKLIQLATVLTVLGTVPPQNQAYADEFEEEHHDDSSVYLGGELEFHGNFKLANARKTTLFTHVGLETLWGESENPVELGAHLEIGPQFEINRQLQMIVAPFASFHQEREIAEDEVEEKLDVYQGGATIALLINDFRLSVSGLWGTETLYSFGATYESHDFPLSISAKLHIQPELLSYEHAEDGQEATLTTEDGHNHDIISHNGVEIAPKFFVHENFLIGAKVFLPTTGEFRPRIYSVLEFHFDQNHNH